MELWKLYRAKQNNANREIITHGYILSNHIQRRPEKDTFVRNWDSDTQMENEEISN